MFTQGLNSAGMSIEKEADVLALSGLKMAILPSDDKGSLRMDILGGRTA